MKLEVRNHEVKSSNELQGFHIILIVVSYLFRIIFFVDIFSFCSCRKQVCAQRFVIIDKYSLLYRMHPQLLLVLCHYLCEMGYFL